MMPDRQSATVHWCPADESHRWHIIAGANGGPGWYVIVQSGCLVSIRGPFDSEATAKAQADARLLALADARRARREARS